MSFDWRELPATTLEQHFNPRVACADAQQHLDDYARRSAAARERIPGRYDLRYGERDKETLDVHTPPDANGGLPLVLFVHGGFWRALDKADHSFVAEPLMNAGAVVANVNYDLCPSITLDEMVDEIARALRYCREQAASWGADPDAMYLIGHSAGAHLCAEMLQRQWPADELPAQAIRGVAALTGIYEPEVILGVSVNQEAQITADVARRRNCLARAFALHPPMLVAVGGAEPEGWQAQSVAFAGACEDAGLDTRMMIVPGANHFTTLDRAVTAGDPLHAAMTALWRG